MTRKDRFIRLSAGTGSTKRGWRDPLPSAAPAAALLLFATAAFGQRAHENAVAEADDAFGTTVGREEIGLYSAKSARGFSPSDAGNLRIDGLYFDQVSEPGTHIVRGSTVHVGISAQGFPFPAPTGVVNFHLRAPGDEKVGSTRLGYTTYGSQAYVEFDFQAPLVDDVLSIGAGGGYARNSSYNIAAHTDDWTAGAIARWRPIEQLTITPFWSMKRHLEQEERSHVFIGEDSYPEFRGVDLMSQSWANYTVESENRGATASLVLGEGWTMGAGFFQSRSESPLNIDPLLMDVDGQGQGNYFLSAAPPRTNRSTSGEVRLSKRFGTAGTQSALHFSVKGRDRRGESGGADTWSIGPGSTRAVPQVTRPDFDAGPTTMVEVTQVTSGIAYEGQWTGVGQLTLGVQKSEYERKTAAPGLAPVTGQSSPWLYNAGAAIYFSPRIAGYASYTRGFEEIGNAPLNARNHGEAVPAQLTEQIDAGLRYEVRAGLQLVAGAFRITKPYFDLDQQDFFRHVGTITNQGLEISLAGSVTDRLTVVSGVILIDPEVEEDLDGSASETTAVGPIPGLFRADFQYASALMDGLTFDFRVESTSSRYARAQAVRLPAVTTVDAGLRLDTTIFGNDVSLRLLGTNLTDEFGLTPSASGKITPFDARSLDLSLAFDF